VDVALLVGVAVVCPVVSGPPERPALNGGGAEQREQELHPARGAEGVVREVAVIEGRDREHPDQVEAQREGDGGHGPAYLED
jgi:hypothetical protein